MFAEEVMHHGVLTVRPDASLDDLERVLLESGVSGCPVLSGDRVVGVVTLMDIVASGARAHEETSPLSDYFSAKEAPSAANDAQGGNQWARPPRKGSFTKQVKDVMSTHVVSVAPHASIELVAKTMAQRHVHRVLVISGQELRGIISSFDIVKLLANGRLRNTALATDWE
ncbi:MAG: CBS domain-containing protein [Gammaproteobacteria bacterium]|nr:CBS domain-containing protein [Gammaproteobacteria bacterium]